MVKRLLFIALLSFLALDGAAQGVDFNDVTTIELQNIGPIRKDGQVSGYYLFYELGKVNRKQRAYLLRILDHNLKKIAEKKITKGKNVDLLEAAFNGKAIAFSFIDYKKRTRELITYNTQMKQIGSSVTHLDKWAYRNYTAPEAAASRNRSLHAVGKEGFVQYTPIKTKKVGYEMNYVPNNLNRTKSWKKASPKKSRIMEGANFIDSDGEVILSAIYRKPKLTSTRNLTYSISLQELATKKELFNQELVTTTNKYSFMNAFLDSDQKQIVVLGEYYQLDDNLAKDKSLGLCALTYDYKGKLISKQHYSWQGDIKKHVDVDEKGRIAGSGYVAIHSIQKTADGHFYVIGELYKKAASAAGIAGHVAQALIGGATGHYTNSQVSMAKIVIKEMVAFKIAPDMKLESVELFPKAKKNINLPAGMLYYPPVYISKFIRYIGGFDYAFTSVSRDKSSFFSTYTSHPSKEERKKTKSSKKDSYLGIISHTDEDATYLTDRIPLKYNSRNIRFFEAKPGYVMMVEYFSKAKKLSMRLEKMNY